MKRDAGMAMIVVLWLSALLTLGLYSLLHVSTLDYGLSANILVDAQVEQAALSGISRAIIDLEADTVPADTRAETWTKTDAARYQNIAIGEVTTTLLKSSDVDPRSYAYGVSDENGRININTAPREILLRMPNATEEIVDAILDWRDEDDTATARGAESSYYLSLNPPYKPRNAALQSVDELLLVRGMTAEILYGGDLNRNGALEPKESDSPGWAPLITAWSVEPNLTLDGQKRLNVNSASQEQLQEVLGPAGVDTQTVRRLIRQRDGMRGFQTVGQILDVRGINKQNFAKFVDRITLTDDAELRGMVNINTASKEVLKALGLTDEEVQAIQQYRENPEGALDNIAWLLEILSGDVFRPLSAIVTVRSYQFRIDSIGRHPTKPIYRRVFAIYDRRPEVKRTLYQRDLTSVGWPMPESQ